MVHITESTVGRRYAGWFIRNTEHAQRVFDALKSSPLPAPPKREAAQPQPLPAAKATGVQKVVWGGAKVVG